METNLFGVYIDDGKLAEYAASTAMLDKFAGYISGATEAKRLRRAMRGVDGAHDALSRRFSDSGSLPPACEWLLDNRYIARREGICAASAAAGERKLRRGRDGSLIAEACRALVSAGHGMVTAERAGEFLRGYQSVRTLTQAELSLFAAALRGALIEALAAVCRAMEKSDSLSEFEEPMAAIFTSLRLLSSIDLAPVIDGANAVEQALRRDPAGVYPLMDEESRALYRAEITDMAKKRDADERQLAEKILALAENAEPGSQGRHVGYWILEKPAGADAKRRTGGLYIAANVLLTLFFSLLFGFITGSVAASLLLLLPVSELVKSLLDFIICKFARPRLIPRLGLDGGVPGDGATVCVVSALLTNRDAGKKLAEKLRRFHYLSRDCGEGLVFGVLADLKEAKTAEADEDGEILSSAAQEIDKLNREFGGGFYLFAREREYCESDNIYRGHERKRGAVMALARLLRGREGEISVLSGDAERLKGAKYILTLDSDTELLPGTARKLIGGMLHPLNAPVVSNGVVVRGHGVIHPRISVELESAGATDFSRVYAGQGGIDPYGGLCGELYMDLFGRGGFAGKGIMDVDALIACCGDRFPDNLILSHDALEGAYLRGGYMSDCEATDGFPGKPLSFFRRLHRWTRGDWQNLAWILWRGRDLSDVDRFKLFDSLRRSLVPPMTFAAIFAGFFMPVGGLATAASAALLALLSNLFLSLADRALQKPGDFSIRYHALVIHGVGGAIMLTFLRLWLLPYEAYICFSATLSSLWRMAVSRKKLLSWETAAQSDGNPNGLWAHCAAMWFAALGGLCCLLLSASIIGRTAGLIWLFAPAAAWALALPARRKSQPTGAQRRMLTECAAGIWAYFDKYCCAEDNFLPPDNVQEQPPVGAAHRTSPTNIGLALISCLAAMDMGVDDGLTAMTHIENMLSTVTRLKKWKGHLYNWYDTRTLRPLEPESISTVDSGNLCACLIALKEGLKEYGRDELARTAEELAREMDFTALYDDSRRLFYIGWDARRDRPAGGVYDLMASEARLTSYLAVARGEASERHWRRLSRAQLGLDGYRGLASWTGTMFEYLMPELFLPLCPDSFMYESAKFCLYAQRRRVRHPLPWGISESAFFALDPALNYRYKANGCGALALKRGQDAELVISPYSTFLALCVEPAAAVRNLHRLRRFGAGCEYGFYEALDFTPSRCRGGEGELVRCVMSHHQGMSMAAAANYLCGGVMCRRFMADAQMGAYRCLLAERVPTGGALLRRDGSPSPEKLTRAAGEKWEIRGEGTDFENPRCCLLSNGIYSIMSTEFGLTSSAFRDTLIYSSPEDTRDGGHGLEMRLVTERGATSLLPEPGLSYGEVLWELSEEGASVLCRTEAFSTKCAVAAASGFSGEIRLVRLVAGADINGFAELSFRPVLASEDDYRNHPAFWRLGMEARLHKGCLLIRRLRRGKTPELWLCVACDGQAEFSADENGGVGFLSSPLVSARVPVCLKAGESAQIRFSLCVGATAEEAYNGAQRLTALGPADYADMPGACAALSGMDAREVGEAMDLVGRLWFARPEALCPRDELWRYSVSGDLPIIMLRPGCPDDAEAPIKQFCLLRCCGVLADLAIVTDDGGEYSRPVSRRVEDVLEKMSLGALLGSYGGVHLLPVSADGILSKSAAVIVGGGAPARKTGAAYFAAPESRSGGVPEHGWDAESFSFYVNLKLPRRVWSDILCCGDFGFIAADSGCGNMWFKNSREQPINPWLCDPGAVSGPETLEIETSEGRRSLFAAEDGFACRVTFGFGWASWEKDFGPFSTRVTAAVPPQGSVRVLTIELTGACEGRILWKTDLTLSGDRDSRGAVSLSYVNRMLFAQSTRSYIDGLRFGAAFSHAPEGFSCDGAKWRRGEIASDTSTGGEPVMGAIFAPADKLIIVCGCCGEDALISLCKPDAADAAIENTRQFWRGILGRFRLSCRDAAISRLMNGWSAYQAICCRLMARVSIYQSGGAFGFRDQLQDSVNVILLDPGYARRQIISSCCHQYAEGDVLHWWHEHPGGDKGVRTRCSDDLLWLCWALCEYTEKTGDLAVCAEEYPYLVSAPLADGENDRYETPAKTDYAESVLSHALRAVDMCLSRGAGDHGLLKFGSGDWNDGMDKVGGESVWLTWFFAHVCERLSRLLSVLCKPDAEKYDQLSRSFGRAADAAWDGGWYLRGYWPDGERLGGRACGCCRIDSIAQSFSALCRDASPQRVDSALSAAVELLFDRENKVIKLFDPPFYDSPRSPGYIESYGPGFRENGGQYTHGAIWLAMACLMRGRLGDGMDMLDALAPENHDLKKYLAEPFVLPADVYSAPGHEGEAGWTWYTGSAGWYFRVVTEELLGLKLKNGRLEVSPRLSDYTAVWTDFEGRKHTVCVKDGKAAVS